MDTISKKKRSEIMRAVKNKDSKIEKMLCRELNKLGYSYKKNFLKLPGKPDIAFLKRKIAIFLDSCFWHGCRWHCRLPHSNIAYWNNKIKRNKIRDVEVNSWYKKNGWTILRFWEHQLQNDFSGCVKKITKPRIVSV